MALIKCPECGKEISDRATSCINCGFPISDYLEETKKEENKKQKPYTICPKCNSMNELGKWICENCGHKYKDKEYNPIYPNKKPFAGIYKYDFWGNAEEVRCPSCKSEDCSHYEETITLQEKTKTTYSANLNPLKPFTLINKNEKVVRPEVKHTIHKFKCNKCGDIFE